MTFHSCYLPPWTVLRKNCDNKCLNTKEPRSKLKGH